MKRKPIAWLLLAALATYPMAAPTRGESPSQKTPLAQVERVVDGDTVVVLLDGQKTTVRLIGVDTPEKVDPRKPVERFGHEAAEFLRELIGTKTVRISYEPSGARLDRHGRKLAYLRLEPGGLFVNREIVAKGFGFAYTKDPFKHLEDFR